MIITDRKALENTARDASGPGWTSLRLLVATDGLGYSMTDTTISPGSTLTLEYKNHVEACYCLEGTGEVTELASGVRHIIRPGTLYAPNLHDRHQVCVTSEQPMRLICVFTPALRGDEVHGPDGSYAAQN